MKMNAIKLFFLTGLIGLLGSCVSQLDQLPTVETTSASVYTSAANYKAVLAKLYASYAIGGNEKGDGNSDMASPTAAYGYLRSYFNLQEIPTDEVIYTWAGGDNLVDIQFMRWGASDTWVSTMYYRVYYTIAICNEFLRNATEDRISGFPGTEQQEIQGFAAEARFLRALAYSHAMDLFGHVPFVTETDQVSAFFPPRITRVELFAYIESELKAIETLLPEPLANEYGRASRAAAWTLLARNYLNAQVYTGTERNADCITYCNKVIDSGFSLEADYRKLFNGDNDRRTRNEIIFPIQADAARTTTWGGTTYLVNSPILGSMNAADYGVVSGWQSFRTLREFVALFPDAAGGADRRGAFWTDGQTLDVEDPSSSSQGYTIVKYTNLNDDGTYTTDDGLVNTDFPLFRLADVYLMYAEATVRGGAGGNAATALGYVNQLRERAYGNTNGNIGAAALTLEFLLAERGRELFWECVRRTDLIRFGRFSGGNYLWQWKGGTVNGSATDARFDLYPIPVTDLAANPNLIQHTGY